MHFGSGLIREFLIICRGLNLFLIAAFESPSAGSGTTLRQNTQGPPFDSTQGPPFDSTQGPPFDSTQGPPFLVLVLSVASRASATGIREILLLRLKEIRFYSGNDPVNEYPVTEFLFPVAEAIFPGRRTLEAPEIHPHNTT